MNYKRSRSIEVSFLTPISIALIVVSLGCLLLTLRWGIRLPAVTWPAESEADQFEVMRRIEACGILILLAASVRKALLSDESSFLMMIRDLLNSLVTLFQICCATMGMTNAGIYVLNLVMTRISPATPPVMPFPTLPLLFLACGLFFTLWSARTDPEPD